MNPQILVCIFISCGISFVASFSWRNCGTSTTPIKVSSLDAYSNRTKILYITGRGKVANNFTAPIQANVNMQKKFFWGWTKVPCIDDLGSCTYKDICQLSPYLNTPCPSEFTINDVPCRCPLLEGQYTVKKFPIDMSIAPHWVEEGSYRIKMILHQEEKEIMCLLVYIHL